jgi:hypothetical protein
MFYLLYKITNLINEKIYVGIHRTENKDDGYMGSGKYIRMAIKKYGKENFKKEILLEFESSEAMVDAEKAIVNEEFVTRRDTYNCELGGAGGKIWTKELREKMSQSQKERFKRNPEAWVGSRNWPEEKRKALGQKISKLTQGENNPMYGKHNKDHMTPEAYEQYCENISKANKGKVRTDEHKKNYSNAAKQRIWIVHRSGKVSHTIKPDDERLEHPDWQRGAKWKD